MGNEQKLTIRNQSGPRPLLIASRLFENNVGGTGNTLPAIALCRLKTHQSLSSDSLAILVATKIQKTKLKIALLIGDYFKIVSYLSEQFLMQFDWGWS